MGVEIKQTLERDYNINMKASDIRLLTLNTLKELGSTTEESTTATTTAPGNVLKIVRCT